MSRRSCTKTRGLLSALVLRFDSLLLTGKQQCGAGSVSSGLDVVSLLDLVLLGIAGVPINTTTTHPQAHTLATPSQVAPRAREATLAHAYGRSGVVVAALAG